MRLRVLAEAWRRGRLINRTSWACVPVAGVVSASHNEHESADRLRYRADEPDRREYSDHSTLAEQSRGDDQPDHQHEDAEDQLSPGAVSIDEPTPAPTTMGRAAFEVD